jgi:hypothetical protein
LLQQRCQPRVKGSADVHGPSLAPSESHQRSGGSKAKQRRRPGCAGYLGQGPEFGEERFTRAAALPGRLQPNVGWTAA